MRLTRYTDYSFRVLIYLGLCQDRLCSIHEIAEAYGISESHLMKVVQALGQNGYVATRRGRSGGLKLARPPHEISVGAVVRYMEENVALVDCFSAADNCQIAGPCRLQHIMKEALEAFRTILDGYTLADLLRPRASSLKTRLGLAAESQV